MLKNCSNSHFLSASQTNFIGVHTEKEKIKFSSFCSLRKQLYKGRECNFTVYKLHDIRLCKFKIQLLQLVIWETEEELHFLIRYFLFCTGEHTSRGVGSQKG